MSNYRVIRHGSRWAIQVLDEDGSPQLDEDGYPNILTCGDPTYAELVKRIQLIQQDDKRIDERKRTRRLC